MAIGIQATHSPTLHDHRLLKILGVGFGVAIAIGGAIGSGILRNPGTVAASLGNGWLIIAAWVLGGIYAVIGANTYAEIATALPEDGGPYVFIRRAYGDFFGFAGGIVDFTQNCCALAYLAITFGEYFGTIVPSAAPHSNAVGMGVLLALAFLNWLGLRVGKFTQELSSLLKVLALLVFVAACFAFGRISDPSAPGVESVTSSPNPLLIVGVVAIALNSVMATYAGWNSAVYFSEENTDPSRSVPRALFGGVLLVTFVYVSVNAALLYALPLGTFAASKLPAADFATGMFGNAGGKLITALTLCSIIGIINAALLYAPRILFSVSRDGFLPAVAARVNRGGTPAGALFILVTMAMIFAFSGTYETLLAIATFLVLTIDSAVYLALFVLRRREPDLPRPYRAFGYPVLPAVVLVGAWFLLVLFVLGNTTDSLYAIGILILIYPVYLALKKLLRTSVKSGTEV